MYVLAFKVLRKIVLYLEMKMTYFQTSLRMISGWHLPQTRMKKYLLKEKILSGYNFRAINSLRIAAKQSDSSMKKKFRHF